MRAIQFGTVLFLAGSLVGCDHATKHFASTHLQGGPPTQLLPEALELLYTENHDMAFGLLDAFTTADGRYPWLVAMKSMAVLFALSLLFFRFRKSGWWEKIGVTAIAAGGIGNLLDRVMRGYVVDFIHVSYWPVFNVADIAVVVGGVCLIAAAHTSTTLSHSHTT
jgi:signal peptidase II